MYVQYISERFLLFCTWQTNQDSFFRVQSLSLRILFVWQGFCYLQMGTTFFSVVGVCSFLCPVQKNRQKPETRTTYDKSHVIFNENIFSLFRRSIVGKVFLHHTATPLALCDPIKNIYIDNVSRNYIQAHRVRSTQHKSGHWARAWPSILLTRGGDVPLENYSVNLECVDKLRDRREMNRRQQYGP